METLPVNVFQLMSYYLPFKTKHQILCYILLFQISSHKTMGTYGRAKIVLTIEEFTWFERFANLRERLPGYRDGINTLFFTRTGSQLRKISHYISMAWIYAGLRRNTTMTDIRSSIATHVSNHPNSNQCNIPNSNLTTTLP